jgi:hypothetical protein
MPLAPKWLLSGVPSSSIIVWSACDWSNASMPTKWGAMAKLTCDTAFDTSKPLNDSPPSRNSKASRLPRDAPAGAMPVPLLPSCSVTSTSTVGLPLESQMRRAWTWVMRVFMRDSKVDAFLRDARVGALANASCVL